jgi:hypothetical protein
MWQTIQNTKYTDIAMMVKKISKMKNSLDTGLSDFAI